MVRRLPGRAAILLGVLNSVHLRSFITRCLEGSVIGVDLHRTVSQASGDAEVFRDAARPSMRRKGHVGDTALRMTLHIHKICSEMEGKRLLIKVASALRARIQFRNRVRIEPVHLDSSRVTRIGL